MNYVVLSERASEAFGVGFIIFVAAIVIWAPSLVDSFFLKKHSAVEVARRMSIMEETNPSTRSQKKALIHQSDADGDRMTVSDFGSEGEEELDEYEELDDGQEDEEVEDDDEEGLVPPTEFKGGFRVPDLSSAFYTPPSVADMSETSAREITRSHNIISDLEVQHEAMADEIIRLREELVSEKETSERVREEAKTLQVTMSREMDIIRSMLRDYRDGKNATQERVVDSVETYKVQQAIKVPHEIETSKGASQLAQHKMASSLKLPHMAA
ncbi:uncharacterized protein EV422DRAFT_306407 [Fimicolochytrium jonesii]|uniref:uncharacterized protein n=1 Tax=Fimicolochytrium jonesii TaxID=1396493 RepID=UPI0022FE71D2|nr:uncharacterized protein EV422DRAFT_306407 [Fimicolochytrium jonesii]KAI8824097.1 hypothetical protein EV422DRAFT_306407 [Fimicolochytrium jonesii]